MFTDCCDRLYRRHLCLCWACPASISMAYSGGFKEEDDELDMEGEEEGGEIKAVNDHCILLIDARPTMFESFNDEGDVRTLAA